MKKSVFRRIFMTGMGIVFFTFSCTNLDEKLYSDVTASNFFKTDEEFIAALGQALYKEGKRDDLELSAYPKFSHGNKTRRI